MPSGFFPLLVLLLLVLLPLLFLNIVTVALTKLGINPVLGPTVMVLMFLGSLVNIPVFRERVDTPISRHPLDIWGMQRYMPHMQRQLTERIVAVNLGGFVIPMLLVVYELVRVWQSYPALLLPLAIAVLINIVVCYWSAKPVPGVGIVMPAFVPGALAALSALLLAPGMSPPVAYCAGVLGPVVGADLLHLNKIRNAQVGIASIGGAGTFDGIVISGLLAVLLV